jgi:hypothetical protein
MTTSFRWSLSITFSYQTLFALLFAPMGVLACPTHLVLLDLFTVIIFGEKYQV